MIAQKEAREVAAQWYNGQNDPLYKFVSTGHISEDVLNSAWQVLQSYSVKASDESARNLKDLLDLYDFLYRTFHQY